VSRLHFFAGILTNLAAPLWLLFVLAGLGLGVQYRFSQQQYFLHASTLFPLWPRIDPVRAARLFGVTLGILLGPKVLGALSANMSETATPPEFSVEGRAWTST
jgi:membrane glycosyltransferase